MLAPVTDSSVSADGSIPNLQEAPDAVDDRAWSDGQHVEEFDYRAAFRDFLLRRHVEAFNEGRLLRRYSTRGMAGSFYEFGWATGAMYRYVRATLPRMSYYGFDVSVPAITYAEQRFGPGRFRVISPDSEKFPADFGPASLVFSRDVAMHQMDPYAITVRLLKLAGHALVMRLRSRDAGKTVLDVERSCQAHYNDCWVPYIVLNTDELIDHLAADPWVARIVVSRRHEFLGGRNGRFLLKDRSCPKQVSQKPQFGQHAHVRVVSTCSPIQIACENAAQCMAHGRPAPPVYSGQHLSKPRQDSGCETKLQIVQWLTVVHQAVWGRLGQQWFHASILDNIRFGNPGARDATIHEALRMACADEFVSELPAGIGTVLVDRGQSLSGGQRQRIALARAFVSLVDVLVLDGPTSALDADTKSRVIANLIFARAWRGVILITHKKNLLTLADKVLVIQNGQVVETGSHGMSRERGEYYRRIFNLMAA